MSKRKWNEIQKQDKPLFSHAPRVQVPDQGIFQSQAELCGLFALDGICSIKICQYSSHYIRPWISDLCQRLW